MRDDYDFPRTRARNLTPQVFKTGAGEQNRFLIMQIIQRRPARWPGVVDRHPRHRKVVVHLGNPVHAFGHRVVETVDIDHSDDLLAPWHRARQRPPEIRAADKPRLVQPKKVTLHIGSPGLWRPVQLSGGAICGDADVIAQEAGLVGALIPETRRFGLPGSGYKNRFRRCRTRASWGKRKGTARRTG